MRLTAEYLSRSSAVRHGFFTRRGGVSEGIYASLNCGNGSGDTADRVAENRRRAMAELGLDPASLLTVYQMHSPEVVTVTGPWSGPTPRADAMVTSRPGVALGILTADCAPVLLADGQAGVIGAAHAGWRGALAGVVEATVAAMEALGAQAERMSAAIGPCIAQASYEVGPEFREPFLAADGANGALFVEGRNGRPHFDLPGFVGRRLISSGVSQVAVLARDTCAEAEDFFSYRRSCKEGAPDYGRNLSAIAVTEA